MRNAFWINVTICLIELRERLWARCPELLVSRSWWEAARPHSHASQLLSFFWTSSWKKIITCNTLNRYQSKTKRETSRWLRTDRRTKAVFAIDSINSITRFVCVYVLRTQCKRTQTTQRERDRDRERKRRVSVSHSSEWNMKWIFPKSNTN